MTKKILLHAGIVAALLAVACAYLAPALGGKAIRQGDIQKGDAMAYTQRQAKEHVGHVPYWAPSMFSGMPGYQITNDPQHSAFQPLRDAVTLHHIGLERNIGILFLYLLGFYVAMLAFGAGPWLALVGALAFGLGSYNIIIIEAGHVTKAWAMAMMAPVLAGMYMALNAATDPALDPSQRKRRALWGTLLFTLALTLQISFNHIQITFYTALGCAALGIAYLVRAVARKALKPFLLKAALLLLGGALAFGSNAKLLLVNEEYARHTMRGGNELTVTPADLYGESAATTAQNTSTGLDIDYAFSWSYGLGETYTLLVPGAYGGGSGERVGTNSSFYKSFRTEYAPLYWGDQPFTSGPVYFGAIVIMLFLLGMIAVRGPERWWILAATLLAILLAWGHNLMGFNQWVFDTLPFYNKFRTPSMALVLANVCMAIMAVLALKAVLDPARDPKRINRALYIAAGSLAALILVVMAASGSFAYSGTSDQQMAAQYGPQWDTIRAALVSDRAALLRSDSWRSLLFILLAAAALWLFNNGKVKKQGVAVALVGVLVLVDLWGVDRRYLNTDNFVEKSQLELRRDPWDYDIDQQAAAFGDQDYRVLNLAVNTFNDSKPSAFHDQIGGYSAAKLSRYQNLIDFYLSRRIKPEVLNMLNARYIVQQQGQQAVVMRNPDALGNAWFVQELKPVDNPNDEILALNEFNPARTAIVDMTQPTAPRDFRPAPDSTATIAREHQAKRNPDYLAYRSRSASPQLAVFSEIHYAPDWRAYIDGKPADYFRADYVLRAMVIPAGEHLIEFKNEAPKVHSLNRITLAVSLLTLLAMAAAIALTYRKKKQA
ncbi:MAG: hypothetical protein J6I49_01765 [Bacteroidales bacterium]|nr:hypothetical protein [Bacteroidales bacterium]